MVVCCSERISANIVLVPVLESGEYIIELCETSATDVTGKLALLCLSSVSKLKFTSHSTFFQPEKVEFTTLFRRSHRLALVLTNKKWVR